ncbi:AAA family ATPase [Photobacterium carnosum]|uniref:AAA family ATPase n=1 Tax=Photobacterium carnosum TaxID=2023717 RepID=UPI001E3291A9|nr:AAA family ATPase [Photobacterium carnosum]MCD9551540.1 AAA family ATPase [Photobacterium carnosum]
MLRRIRKIEGIGSYHSARAGGTQFSNVNIIYGENRNGKSTLCDIFYSLALNNPELIKDRKAIPRQGTAANAMKVEFQFDNAPISVFANETWAPGLPADCELHIFDHNFIHRNVMSGTVNNRENSENISNFILGEENTERFEDLKAEKETLATTNVSLRTAKAALEASGITDVVTYVASELPIESIEELNIAIAASIAEQESLTVQIGSVTQSKARKNLKEITTTFDITAASNEINECLATSMEEAHTDAKALVQAHMEHLKKQNSFKGWASSGLSHLDENCPFCGQELQGESLELIESYKVAFNEAFSNFIRETKASTTQLLTKQLITIDEQAINRVHEENKGILDLYPEQSVTEQIVDLILLVDDMYEVVKASIDQLSVKHNELKPQVIELLNVKIETAYNPVDIIDFLPLQSAINSFNDAKEAYKVVIESINEKLIEFKNGLDSAVLTATKTTENTNQKALENKKLRHTLEEKCATYRLLSTKAGQDQETYNNNKETLEASQEEFLDNYFDEINLLFQSLGSRNFNISRKQNNGGRKIVYDLEISFNGTIVPRNKMNCLFSESDRRALALCIYLAKINKLSNEDKAKAILVMDDPVTSFDNERISSILNKLYEILPSIKQLFITTHYRGMAATAIKKFANTSALKIIKVAHGSDFAATTEAEMTATEHDDAYNEITAFINNETQDNKILILRPFLETELRHRYKDQLRTNGATLRTDFSVCIDILKNNCIITEAVANRIHSFRTALNPAMHELAVMNIEDVRNTATDMMDLVYNHM